MLEILLCFPFFLLMLFYHHYCFCCFYYCLPCTNFASLVITYVIIKLYTTCTCHVTLLSINEAKTCWFLIL